jgi:carboxylate-amine ligase
MTTTDPSPSADRLRDSFDANEPWTVGLEEELMLVDASTGELLHDESVHEEIGAADARFKRELPVSQVEIVLPPAAGADAVVAELREARAALREALPARAAAIGCGAHPAAPAEGRLSAGDGYAVLAEEYGPVARRQLICALQVHVAPGSAERALPVYNALRGYLPEIAALAANAPFRSGRDSGMASVRPKVAEGLPRQGVPPAFATWEELAEGLAWTSAAGGTRRSTWWWELRLHPSLGTLELRVPDAQTTCADAAGVASFAQCLIAWLGERADAGEQLPVHDRWRIEQNRWSANRHGVEGMLADLGSGERRPTRGVLLGLIEQVAGVAERIGAAAGLAEARRLAERNGAVAQRDAVARLGSVEGLAVHLADRFLES